MSCAQVAQLVEQRTENPRVGGSNPPPGTTFYTSDFNKPFVTPHWLILLESQFIAYLSK